MKREIEINGNIFVETDRLILCTIQEADKDKYITLSYENSIMKSFFKDEQFIDDLWSTFMKENSFVCSIFDKETKEFIRDLTNRLAMEKNLLMRECTL